MRHRCGCYIGAVTEDPDRPATSGTSSCAMNIALSYTRS
jgi:hypothetical protein